MSDQTIALDKMRIYQMLNVASGALEPIVREVLAAIDQVHEFPVLPPMPVVYTDVDVPFGAYVPEREGSPRHFQLSRRSPHPRLTLAHEIGHLIDHALGDFDDYLSREAQSSLSEAMQAIERSDAIHRMRSFLSEQPGLDFDMRMQLRYWLDPPEMWARAYAQYIAVRSHNPRLQNDLQISQDLEGVEIYQNVQWQSQDFQPIATAIEEAFRKLGWLE